MKILPSYSSKPSTVVKSEHKSSQVATVLHQSEIRCISSWVDINDVLHTKKLNLQ